MFVWDTLVAVPFYRQTVDGRGVFFFVERTTIPTIAEMATFDPAGVLAKRSGFDEDGQ